jgi:hypothetical protein
VCAAVYKDFLYAGVGEELERVFDERGIREGQQTLRACQHVIGRHVGPAYSWVLEGEGTKACLEGVRKYLES